MFHLREALKHSQTLFLSLSLSPRTIHETLTLAVSGKSSRNKAKSFIRNPLSHRKVNVAHASPVVARFTVLTVVSLSIRLVNERFSRQRS